MKGTERRTLVTLAAALLALSGGCLADSSSMRTGAEPDEGANARAPGLSSEADRAPDPDMQWWRDARFGMFIHWGLYAIPAGKWGEKDSHGEWIRDTGQIPVAEYDRFVSQFNPTKFDAREWVRLAQDAGMGYMVITSKHHDGFCLFDSKQTDFDVMSTPFKRDIIKELAQACKESRPAAGQADPLDHRLNPAGVRFGIYHSIMDWHHPDYLPRRPWEKAQRPEDGAEFDRYVAYMKAQLRELLTNYGPMGVLWFDGQWEGTWNNERGLDLQKYVRSLQPTIIINSRVGRGGGAYGLDVTEHGERLGDYGTPEQFIPDTNPGIDWETCMTMNGHWGYNAADNNFKSTTDLVQKLCDIASKGGNFLLNVGPTAQGEIPPESVQRLRDMGEWMKVNAESIRGTQASPTSFVPPWGCITMRRLESGNTLLYLHVFEMPEDGVLTVQGLLNKPVSAGMLQHPSSSVMARVPVREADGIITLDVSGIGAGARVNLRHVYVFTLELTGEAEPSDPPSIESFASQFVNEARVTISARQKNADIRYTTDGSLPTARSAKYEGPFTLSKSALVTARAFRDGEPLTTLARAKFSQVGVRGALAQDRAAKTGPGLKFDCYEGDWNTLPIFDTMTPTRSEVLPALTLARVTSDDRYGVRFAGFIDAPKSDVYTIYLSSDDGSRLLLSGSVLINNDGLHSEQEKAATVALDAGLHPIVIEMFEKTGGAALSVKWATATMPKQPVPASAWRHE
ncbi:MAG: alpha-L-fucosidase [Phycisphaerales bacterium]